MGKKILVLGTGAQGSTVAQRMDEEPNVDEIICADADHKAVDELVKILKKAKGTYVDADDVDSIIEAAQGVDLILDGGHIVNAGAVAAFELFVSVSCVAMYLVLRNMNRHFSSPTVNAELYIWKLDAYSTGGVGLAFLIQLILQFTPLSFVVPYIDPAIAIFMALILAREPITMIWDAIKSLILAAPGKDVMEQIRSKAEDILKGYDLYIDFLDVVKTGRKIWVDVYITQKDDMLSISSLKLAHDEIVARLKPEYQDVFVELIPEIEPDKLPG